MNVYSGIHKNRCNSCQDISLETTNVMIHPLHTMNICTTFIAMHPTVVEISVWTISK